MIRKVIIYIISLFTIYNSIWVFYISYCLFVYNISNLLKINHLSRNNWLFLLFLLFTAFFARMPEWCLCEFWFDGNLRECLNDGLCEFWFGGNLRILIWWQFARMIWWQFANFDLVAICEFWFDGNLREWFEAKKFFCLWTRLYILYIRGTQALRQGA